MRLAFITAAALLVAGPALAQQAKPLFPHPADANKDGVVTDEERLDHQSALPDSRPVKEIGVAPPKSTGDGVTFKLAEPVNELDKRAVKASSFEEAQNAQAEKALAKKDD
eukprot:gene28399-28734_t